MIFYLHVVLSSKIHDYIYKKFSIVSFIFFNIKLYIITNIRTNFFSLKFNQMNQLLYYSKKHYE